MLLEGQVQIEENCLIMRNRSGSFNKHKKIHNKIMQIFL